MVGEQGAFLILAALCALPTSNLTMLSLNKRIYCCVQALKQAKRAASTVSAAPAQAEASTSTWTPASQRTGVLAKKLGMTAIYDSNGVRTPVTVLEVNRKRSQARIPVLMRGYAYRWSKSL